MLWKQLQPLRWARWWPGIFCLQWFPREFIGSQHIWAEFRAAQENRQAWLGFFLKCQDFVQLSESLLAAIRHGSPKLMTERNGGSPFLSQESLLFTAFLQPLESTCRNNVEQYRKLEIPYINCYLFLPELEQTQPDLEHDVEKQSILIKGTVEMGGLFSEHSRMVWVRKDVKNYLVLTPCCGQETFSH